MKKHSRPPIVQVALWGLASGLLAGCGAFVFLEGLDQVTQFRQQQSWLLLLLPAVGLIWGWLQWVGHRHEGVSLAMRSTSGIISEARQPQSGVSVWQAPLVLVGTWAAHLGGASVGREGVGLQVSASLSEHVARLARMDPPARRLLLVGALAGGFGAFFGVPWAGALFAIEVAGRPRWRLSRLTIAVIASWSGHLMVLFLGYRHSEWFVRPATVELRLAATLVVVAVIGALVARIFVIAVDELRNLAQTYGLHPVLRPAIGGAATVALALLVGRDSLGLSLPLLDGALSGADTAITVPALKAVFTILAVGSGFPGGEVTPLFVIGATLGSALAPLTGVAGPMVAAAGMTTVFAAASGAPLASAVMATELWGADVGVLLLVPCLMASMINRRRQLYATDTVLESLPAQR